MIVLDASALLEWLLQTPAGERVRQRIAAESLHVPHLLDLEVAQVLRRFCAAGLVSSRRAEESLEALREVPLLRHAHAPLLPRIWSLRAHLSAYDAAYVALAEALDAPLLTRDARISAATGHTARVELT